MTQYFWCLEHQRVESGDEVCRAEQRMGPYPSPEAARNWKQTSEARNDAWDEADEDWEDAGG
jgi:hypothetical protein